jgi:hypothetical protein
VCGTEDLACVALASQAAAAIKARSIALTEEKEIQRLIHQVLKRQLTKLQSKLANFEKVFNLCRIRMHCGARARTCTVSYVLAFLHIMHAIACLNCDAMRCDAMRCDGMRCSCP